MQAKFEEAKKYFEKGGKILVVSHRKPDPDTLGAALALKLWLDSLKKKTDLACIDKIPSKFDFLPFVDEFRQDFDLDDYDLMVVVDAGASYMTNFHLKYDNFLSSGIPIINIDHHASNDNYGTLNIVDAKAASTTTIITRMFDYLEIGISPKIATSLLAGMYSDTGSFMHSNTNSEVLKFAGDLINLGADFKSISKSLFKSNSVSTLRLWGKVLENMQITDENVVMSVIGDKDYKNVNSSSDELSGIIDYLNMIPNAKFSLLLNEDEEGYVKGSMRTRHENLDLSKIAANFGGGGHPKASGFSLKGKIFKDINYKIFSEKEQSFKKLQFS